MSEIHDTTTHGALPGGRWEDLGDGRYQRIGEAEAAPKKKKTKKKTETADDG